MEIGASKMHLSPPPPHPTPEVALFLDGSSVVNSLFVLAAGFVFVGMVLVLLFST